jgi:LacI family transcriptional regulator
MQNVKRSRVTIRDVAREAQVSLQTVSRVINRHPDVAEQTRAQVQSVIDRLRYQPSGIARSLVGASTRTLGVIGAGFDFFGPSQMLVGVERQATALGFHISLQVVADTTPSEYARIAGNLISQHVDGVIWAYPELTGEHEQSLYHTLAPYMPIVFLSMAPQPNLAVIGVDNRAGARMATEHLIQRGYRQIGIVTGQNGLWSTGQRLLGWRDALLAAGLPHGEEHVVHGDWSARSGEQGLRVLHERLPELDAVFASNDQMALGVLRAAAQLGRPVPAALGVVGFDNMPESAYFMPALTTIQHDLVELGRLAVRELRRVMATHSEGVAEEPASLIIQPQLIIRESTR